MKLTILGLDKVPEDVENYLSKKEYGSMKTAYPYAIRDNIFVVLVV